MFYIRAMFSQSSFYDSYPSLCMMSGKGLVGSCFWPARSGGYFIMYPRLE